MLNIQYIIELSNYCNFRCTYCYLHQANSIRDDYNIMTPETGEKLAQYFCNQARTNDLCIYIDFLDGEPLFNFETMELITRICRKFEDDIGRTVFVIRFTTNGSYLSREIIEFTIKYNVFFNISIDGSPSSHDSNRLLLNGEGSSGVVYDKLGLLYEYSHTNFGVVSTFAPNTYMNIENDLKYLKNIGVRHLAENLCMGDVKYDNKNNVISHYSKGIDLFLSWYSNYDFSCRFIILDNILGQLYSDIEKTEPCLHPFKIDWQGNILSCDRINSRNNVPITNISENMDISILNARHLCVEKVKPSKCMHCAHHNYCMYCNIYANAKDSLFCEVMKCIITKAMEFYGKHKDDNDIRIQFDKRLIQKFLQGEYIEV